MNCVTPIWKCTQCGNLAYSFAETIECSKCGWRNSFLSDQEYWKNKNDVEIANEERIKEVER
jgi:ribosomal protein L37E